MDASADESDPGRRRVRVWILLVIPALVILSICALLAYLVTRPPVYRITPSMQQTAAKALRNPGAAPLNLDTYSYEWYPPDMDDYAVQDRMVIFPQRTPTRSLRAYSDTLVVQPDKEMPALVFAPDGLAPDKLLPDLGRSWYYLGEWYLDDCHPIEEVGDWYQCVLIVGGNI